MGVSPAQTHPAEGTLRVLSSTASLSRGALTVSQVSSAKRRAPLQEDARRSPTAYWFGASSAGFESKKPSGSMWKCTEWVVMTGNSSTLGM